jgi:hypothetical protein
MQVVDYFNGSAVFLVAGGRRWASHKKQMVSLVNQWVDQCMERQIGPRIYSPFASEEGMLTKVSM